jgi:hypothetical protein
MVQQNGAGTKALRMNVDATFRCNENALMAGFQLPQLPWHHLEVLWAPVHCAQLAGATPNHAAPQCPSMSSMQQAL